MISGNPSLYGNGQISVKEAYDNMDALMQRGAPFAAEAAAAQAAISAPTASIPASASISTISTPAVKSVPPAAAGVNIPKMEETRVPVPLGGSDSPSLRVRLQRHEPKCARSPNCANCDRRHELIGVGAVAHYGTHLNPQISIIGIYQISADPISVPSRNLRI